MNQTMTVSTPERITDEQMQANAIAAAARGAALLDRVKPGWSSTQVVPFAPDRSPVNHMVDPDDDVAVEDFLNASGKGDVVRYTPIRETKESPTFFEVFVGLLAGDPKQETEAKRAEQIDMEHYGLAPGIRVIGLGHTVSGTKLSEEDRARKGFCIVKAGRFLAAAWDAEVTRRRVQ